MHRSAPGLNWDVDQFLIPVFEPHGLPSRSRYSNKENSY